MQRSARSVMLSGVIMLVVSAVVLAPVRPAPVPIPTPAVRLLAAVPPTQQAPQPPVQSTQRGASEMLLAPPSATAATLPNLLVGWLARIIVPPSASAPFPQPDFPAVVAGNSIDSLIKNVYNAVEPWVQYGFELAAYAAGWVPYVGWLAPQIMIFYNLVERIVQSITFNIADWLGGSISFWDGLANVVVDTVNSFIYFANDELAFWLPPLPPLPPIGPLAADDPDAGLMMTSLFDETPELAGTEDLGEEATQEEFVGEEEELTQGEEFRQDEVPGELDVDLDTDGEEQIEEIAKIEADEEDEQIDTELTVDNSTTTNSSGTVQAQGEIRESTVATPTVTSPQTQSSNGAPEELTEQTPTTTDDETQNTSDPDPGEGTPNTAGAE